jgi:hypothetical protein
MVVASAHALVVLTVSHDSPVANPFNVMAVRPPPRCTNNASSTLQNVQKPSACATRQHPRPRSFKQEQK